MLSNTEERVTAVTRVTWYWCAKLTASMAMP